MIYRITFFLILIASSIFAQRSNLDLDHPSDIFPLYYQAIENAADGYFEEAIPVFHKLLTIFPNHQEANLLLDVCNSALVNKISTDAAETFFQAVYGSANFDDIKRIIELFEKAISVEEHYFPFFLIRGGFFLKKEKYTQALSDYSKAVQLAPEFAMAYYNRGKLYLEMMRKEEALQDFNTAISLNPTYAAVFVQRGKIYADKGFIDKALSDYQLARSINPLSTKKLEYSAILNNIGTIYINRNNYQKAIIAFDEAIEADDRWYEPYLNRGIAYRSVNDFEKALNDLNTAIKLKPEMGKIWYNRGLTYKEKMEFDRAEKDLIHSTTFPDTDIRVYYLLAEVYRELKMFNTATDFYKKAIELEKDNIWAYFQLGGLYDRRRDFENAVIYYEKFLELAPNEYFKHKIDLKKRVDKLKKYIRQQRKLLGKDN